MGGTLVVNLVVVAYERREGGGSAARCCSPTPSTRAATSLTSGTVIAALVGVTARLSAARPVAALVVAGFIGHACWEIFQEPHASSADAW